MSHPFLPAKHSSAETPEWFRDAKARAASLAKSLPMPSRRDESWRFSNLKAFAPDAFAPAGHASPEASQTLIDQSTGVDSAGAAFVFVNDRVTASRTCPKLSQQGVVHLPLQDALQTHSELIKNHFAQRAAELGSSKFLALHQASVTTGTFLHVPKGVHVEAPIQAFHWLSGVGQAVYPYTLIIADEDSSVTFVDWFKSASDERNLACAVNDLHLAKGAKVDYVSVQEWSKHTVSLHSNTNSIATAGSVHHLGLHLGGSFSRSESVSHLQGAEARANMLAATVADGDQEFDQRTLQEHHSAQTFSDLLYKNALYDRSKTIVSGLIKVHPNAHRTDAFQKVRNLVLSPEAEANSLPGLEILADDVRCSHGATTGEINPEELFYMQARGISTRDAYRLITFGFLNEVLERFPHEDVVNCLQERLRSRLHGH